MSPKLRVEMFYVYLWLREDRTPYYVGKGKGYRAFSKHRKATPPPKDRIIIVKEFEDEEESYLFEEWLIQIYGRKCDGGILINQSIGGQHSGSKYRNKSEYEEIRRKQNRDQKRTDRGKETNLRWRTANPEKVKASAARFRERNREKINEYARGEGSEKKKESQKKYREKNREKLRESSRLYYQRKKLEASAYQHTT